ncbi:DUF5320 domain-containing protein [Aminobacterium colombiense]|uniref:Putative cytoplasmic protein n=1 Tax=Aminobacterium colombiense (strain DSM 12261 / ALA-1) TaxID=572547 RepID=D5EC86_AMICL|nr:DUF5320 domain-containing protein [Aminobacterium colombiense]ADE56168.1 putative cytoplasmic protein [Aminobacterium colombiense DSM 12261]
MPGYDGSGPRGQGPMTGRGFGYCRFGGYGYRRFPRRGRRFFGFGRGMGGWGAPVYPGWGYEPSIEEERNVLQEELSVLEEEMENMRKRLAELEENK